MEKKREGEGERKRCRDEDMRREREGERKRCTDEDMRRERDKSDRYV